MLAILASCSSLIEIADRIGFLVMKRRWEARDGRDEVSGREA